MGQINIESSQEFMNEVCSELFANTKIRTVSFLRFLYSGKTLYLCSNKKWRNYALENKLYENMSIYKYVLEAKGSHIQKRLWNGLGSIEFFDRLKYFNLCHGVTFFQNFESGFEVIGFSSSSEEHSIINFYEESFQYLKDFIHYFRERLNNQTKTLQNVYTSSITQNQVEVIKQHRQNIINIKTNFFPNSCFATKKYFVDIEQQLYLTSRQYQCLLLLSQGKTHKEIAQLLRISPRSVDNHIDSIKTKFNINYKSGLIELFRTYFV